MEERRKYPRIEDTVPLKLDGEEADFITETINLSAGGLYCKVNRYIPVMTKFKITMLLPEERGKRRRIEKIKCEGIVVRVEPEYPEDKRNEYNIAIFISNINKEDRQRIEKYVIKKARKSIS